ncbi:MAG TPA: DUF2652 domain-containing protein, partial [Candidatus Dormibacteraeota bacterium]|nr:DUF2652 domain-containing protein [Candidatus Dormibacteraeota bacterium]
AFVYALTERLDASSLLDSIEATYFAFRRRLRDIRQATTCTCNACRLIPALDLKVVAHHGVVIRQRVAGREELVGSDVVLVHRLLKNDVAESGGPAAYALLTAACLEAAGVDPDRLGVVEHLESFEGVGEVRAFVHDLGAAWERELAATRVVVSLKDALVVTRRLPVEPPVAWEYVTAPSERTRWQQGVTAVVEDLPDGSGRRGVGTTNHCMHGEAAVVEEVLDWRPFEYLTVRSTLPYPGAPKVRTTITLDAVDDGTDVSFRVERPRSAKLREAMAPVAEGYVAGVHASFDALTARLAAEHVGDPKAEAGQATEARQMGDLGPTRDAPTTVSRP